MSEAPVTIKQAIDCKAKKIISLVSGFANDHYDTITRTRDGKKQFVDLVEAANQACCVDEFKLYIKYKASKEGTRGMWGGLAVPFNETIEKLMNEVAFSIEKERSEDNSEKIRLEVLKRFCGYLMWREHADIAEKGVR